MSQIRTRWAPYLDLTLPASTRAADLLLRMTLAEKIGQMTQVEKNSITPERVGQHAIGSILSGGGGSPTPNTPQAWADMVRAFQEAALETRLGIPLIYGVDAVHGHNNVIGATIFPHNIGLGATRNPDLVERVAVVTAREMRATNVHWNFAPAVSVPQDIRWGRTYEGFSEDTGTVAALSAAYVRGLQEPVSDAPLGALASVKHFVGDGGTRWNSTEMPAWLDWWKRDVASSHWRIDQGICDVDEAALRSIHLPPYEAAIAAGARNIMVSYSSWGGQKMHAQRYLLTEVLKGELGFDGFLVSDWLAVQQLAADFGAALAIAINAGLDMIMVPFDYKCFQKALVGAVERGTIPQSRIDDAVRRILEVKFELGLFEAPFGDESLLDQVGCASHRGVARQAVRESLVLLKNEGHALPLSPRADLLVAGQAANDIGLQCGGWTISWSGSAGAITPGTTLVEAFEATLPAETSLLFASEGNFSPSTLADTGIVVLAEPPYAEGMGDSDDLSLTDEQVALVRRVRPHCRQLILVLFSGRPLILGETTDLCDAIVAAWLPGTEGAGIADVLLGDHPFRGRLPVTWPRSMKQVPQVRAADPLWPIGFGLS